MLLGKEGNKLEPDIVKCSTFFQVVQLFWSLRSAGAGVRVFGRSMDRSPWKRCKEEPNHEPCSTLGDSDVSQVSQQSHAMKYKYFTLVSFLVPTVLGIGWTEASSVDRGGGGGVGVTVLIGSLGISGTTYNQSYIVYKSSITWKLLTLLSGHNLPEMLLFGLRYIAWSAISGIPNRITLTMIQILILVSPSVHNFSVCLQSQKLLQNIRAKCGSAKHDMDRFCIGSLANAETVSFYMVWGSCTRKNTHRNHTSFQFSSNYLYSCSLEILANL